MISNISRPDHAWCSAHVRGMQRPTLACTVLDTGSSTCIGWLAAQMVGPVEADPIFRGAAAAYFKRQSEPQCSGSQLKIP
jgi:hypothetical protein